MTKLTAFWDYDRFPYTLYSEVDKFSDKPGVVIVKGYGGASFHYKHILPEDIGSAAINELETLEHERNLAVKKVEGEYSKKLVSTLNRYGIPTPSHLRHVK